MPLFSTEENRSEHPPAARPLRRRFAHVYPRRVAGVGWAGIRQATRRDPVAGSQERGNNVRVYTVLTKANLPRSALTKRLLVPLVVISRAIAEYSVAAGVLPPGEVQ